MMYKRTVHREAQKELVQTSIIDDQQTTHMTISYGEKVDPAKVRPTGMIMKPTTVTPRLKFVMIRLSSPNSNVARPHAVTPTRPASWGFQLFHFKARQKITRPLQPTYSDPDLGRPDELEKECMHFRKLRPRLTTSQR